MSEVFFVSDVFSLSEMFSLSKVFSVSEIVYNVVELRDIHNDIIRLQ
jgi:hypothetical protein